MNHHSPTARAGAVAAVLLLAALAAPAAVPARAAATPDWDVPGGHYFSQAGGFTVSDAGGVRFWSEFQRLGGVERLGYPISRRFDYRGFVTQAFQKLVLQWRPEQGRAAFINVFDELTGAGKDDWLRTVRSTPRPLRADDAGKPWSEVVATRLALLDANPAIRAAYNDTADPIEDRGLPTSPVEDLGPLVAIRTQRVVLQQWKSETAWATAGQVVVANGGDLAKEAGLFPAAALAPEKAELPETAEMARINAYRVAAGVEPARTNPALMQAAEQHVAYYDANRGDPALAGMGLHRERPDAAGFSGVTIGDRARAAGYRSGAVTENAGWGGIERAVDWYMNTVNHRLPVIHPSALDFGYAASSVDGFGIIDAGLRRDRLSVQLPSVYPANGATDVPLSWDGAETPDPAPGAPRPLGYPITVAFAISQQVAWQSFELRSASGESLPISTPVTGWMRAAAIIPLAPLQPGQTYTARVAATVDGKPLTKEWGFTTRGG